MRVFYGDGLTCLKNKIFPYWINGKKMGFWMFEGKISSFPRAI